MNAEETAGLVFCLVVIVMIVWALLTTNRNSNG